MTDIFKSADWAREAERIVVDVSGWPPHERQALEWLCGGARVALLIAVGGRPHPRQAAKDTLDRWRDAVPGLEIKYQTWKVDLGGGSLHLFVYEPNDPRAWEKVAGLHFDFAAIDPIAAQSKMAMMLLTRVRYPA